jgi:hypothetical protein
VNSLPLIFRGNVVQNSRDHLVDSLVLRLQVLLYERYDVRVDGGPVYAGLRRVLVSIHAFSPLSGAPLKLGRLLLLVEESRRVRSRFP